MCPRSGLTSFYPTDLKARALVNQWLHWNHTNSRVSTMGVIRPALAAKPEERAAAIAPGVLKFTGARLWIWPRLPLWDCGWCLRLTA